MIWVLLAMLAVLIVGDLLARGRAPIVRSLAFIALAIAFTTVGPWPWFWAILASLEGVWLGRLVAKRDYISSVSPTQSDGVVTIRLSIYAGLVLNVLARSIIDEDPDDPEGFEEIVAVLGEQLPVEAVAQMNAEIERHREP